MRYSSGMQAAIVKRVVPPNSELVIAISREAGVSKATIHYWRKQAAEGMLETFREAESQIVKDDVKTEVAKGFSGSREDHLPIGHAVVASAVLVGSAADITQHFGDINRQPCIIHIEQFTV